jgi:hypothetical protein
MEVKDTIPNDVSSSYSKPLKLWKVNIGIDKHPNLASIRDYWNEQTMTEIQALLFEYEDFFSTNLSELKVIKGYLGDMMIDLNPKSRSVKHRPYWLNP